MNNEKKETVNYITKIESIIKKEKNITIEAKINSFYVYELKDTISIYMNITDDTSSINALLVSDYYDEEIQNLVKTLNLKKELKITDNYQIRGNISIVDKDLYDSLNSEEFILKDTHIGDKLLMITSITNGNNDYDTLFGKSMLYLHDCEINELYQLIKSNTNYLDNIDFDKIQDIQITNDKDICILLKDGTFQFNSEKLFDNIHCLWFNCGDVYAINENKKIIPIHCNHDVAKYLNNDDYEYKKIILDLLSLTALTYTGEIKTYGFRIDTGIDYKRFNNVDDIGYDSNNNEVVVIQNEEIRSLFIYSTDNIYDKNQISLNGKGKNNNNYFEII